MNTIVLNPGPDFGTIQPAGYCGDSLECRSLAQLNLLNLGPRLGLAYQLNNKTVIRSGAGLFYGGQGALGASARQVNNWPYSRSAQLQSAGSKPALILSQGFPAGLLNSITTPPAASTWTAWAKDFPQPTIYQWNFTVQRELKGGMSLTAAYVGSSSNYLAGSYNWNAAPPGPPATVAARRPLPQYGAITYQTPYAHSSYNGMNVQLERRFSHGLGLSAAYTWAHSIDNVQEQFGGPGGDIQQTSDFGASRSSSGFDTRQRFVISGVYELPFGKGRALMNRNGFLDLVFGGWQMTSIGSFQTGSPFSITVAQALQRLGADNLVDWRADLVGDPSVPNPNQNLWLNPKAFALPRNAAGVWHYGNSGRNIIIGDGIGNLDCGLMKTFSIRERFRLQFRWEMFNATNSPQYANPVIGVDNPDLGKSQSTINSPRQMQFALRLSF
jgi:hypothetical protein